MLARGAPLHHRRVRVVVLTALALAGAGCVGAIVGTGIDAVGAAVTYPFKNGLFARLYEYDNTSPEPWRALEDDRGRDYGNELVGLAVSGGGSRSAYFLACVLDRLRHIPVEPTEGGTGAAGARTATTLLDEVDFLSAVSGGSLASTYYTLLRPDSSDPAVLDAFFQRFRDDMRLDFEMRSVGRTLLMGRAIPLILTHYHRGHVLAEVFDSNFFHDATFADLPAPGPRRPTLIVNATSYSRGNKFLFTRLPTGRFNDSRLMRGVRELKLIRGNSTELHRPFENTGFDTIASDIASFPLSYAVAASAGVPSLLGPTVLKDKSRTDADLFEELGDGGLYDNYGLETLVQLFASILEERPGMKARIIVVDASSFFEAQVDRPEYTVADYADRIASIAWLRTSDYTEMLYRTLGSIDLKRLEKVVEEGTGGLSFGARQSPFRNLDLQVVSLFHQPEKLTAADLRDDVPSRPSVVAKVYKSLVPEPIRNPAGFIVNLNQEVRGIDTRFSIGDDAADLVDAQAELAVRDVLGGVR